MIDHLADAGSADVFLLGNIIDGYSTFDGKVPLVCSGNIPDKNFIEFSV